MENEWLQYETIVHPTRWSYGLEIWSNISLIPVVQENHWTAVKFICLFPNAHAKPEPLSWGIYASQ